MSDLTPTQTFEQKMADRIRKDIGDLMPDEKLAEIVDRVISKSFFEPVRIPSGSYSADTFDPPPLEGIIKEVVAERVRSHVDEYFKSNPEKLLKTVEMIMQTSLEDNIIKALKSALAPDYGVMHNMIQGELMNQLNNNNNIY